MSYGIWKKRGEGWSSIEIDTPGNHYPRIDNMEVHEYWKNRYSSLKSRCNKIGMTFDGWYGDFYQIQWECGQRERNPDRSIIAFAPGYGEHTCWISYDSIEALDRALAVNQVEKSQIEEVISRAQKKHKKLELNALTTYDMIYEN